MKKRYISFLHLIILLVGVLSACMMNVLPTPSEAPTDTPAPNLFPEPSLTSTPVDGEITDRPLWQDAYVGFMRENMQTSVDQDTFAEGSDEEARCMAAFSAGGYPATSFFYLYDIDKDGIPELIYIDAANGYDGDVYTYENHSISKIGSIKFYPFGGLGIPLDKTEGLYSDIGYKGHYGEIYLYTINNGILTEQMILEYNNQQELSPEKSGLPYSFDNFTSLDYYEVTEANITKVIYDGD